MDADERDDFDVLDGTHPVQIARDDLARESFAPPLEDEPEPLRWRWWWLLVPLVVLAGVGGVLLAALLFGGGGDSDPVVITETPNLAQRAEWPQDVTFVSHTVPARIRHDIDFVGTQHGYRFEGLAGQTWQLLVTPVDGSTLHPQVSLYYPSGALWQTSTPGAAGADLLLELPESGAYRVLVQGGATTGMYYLVLYEVR